MRSRWAYSRVLYDDGNLIVVGNLLEYPEEYLQMTRTVYEEVGIEGKEVTSDLRNSFTEMTQVTVYSVSEENPADLSLSRDYYQAGWCRDAAVTESGTLYTVTNKSIYGVNGVTEYLTEVIPVVGTKEGLSYLDVNRIYVDDLSSELDSYVVVLRTGSHQGRQYIGCCGISGRPDAGGTHCRGWNLSGTHRHRRGRSHQPDDPV